MTRYFALAAMVAFAGCSDARPGWERAAYPPGGKVCTRPVDSVETVSIATLLTRPQQYEGRSVRISGYYKNKFEHSAIYLHQDDARYSIHANGLWVLGRDLASVGNRYVTLEGVFTGTTQGHMSQWPATICNVRAYALTPDEP